MQEPLRDVSVKSGQPFPPGFQFGLRHLLSAIAFLSIACAILFVVPNWVASAIVIVASVLFAAGFTSAVVHSSGDIRAFCIGALFPIVLIAIPAVCLFVVVTFESFRDDYGEIINDLERGASGMRFVMVVGSLLTPIAGVLSVFVRGYLKNRE